MAAVENVPVSKEAATSVGVSKVWTDGFDIVVALDVQDVPSVLNRHYRVTGHTVRHERWKEVAPTEVVRLKTPRASVEVEASALASQFRNAWVGRLR